MAQTFLQGVTRIMRAEGILRGDTDAPTTFSDLQHGATISMAQLAIQDELTELVSDSTIPYEHKSTGTISTVAGTRSYALASDFVRFYGEPSLYESSGNLRLYEWRGGEQELMLYDPNYKSTQGTPNWWYFDETTTKKLAFYNVPSGAKTYTYDYEYDVSVSAATDTLPFTYDSEAYAFLRLAARRFKFLYQGMDLKDLAVDPEHMKAKATLFNLLAGKRAPGSYAPVYR